MKKITILTAIGLSALMLLSACKNTSNDSNRDSDTTAENRQSADNSDSVMLNDYRNDAIVIADKNGSEIGRIETCNAPMLTEEGVLYAAWPEGANDDSTMEYRLFDQKTGEDRKLGEVSDPAYEDTTSRVEIDGKVYSLAMFGDLTDSEPDPLYLQEIDLIHGSVSLCPILPNGYPYQSMCRVGNKLLLFVHDQQADGTLYDRVFEFDPETKNQYERMTFQYSENDQIKQGDTIRSLYSNGKNIYMLRVHAENNVSSLFVDTYDLAYTKQAEKDISAIFAQGLNEYDPVADPAFDMFYQVARFFVTEDGMLYYLNFSDLSFLADLSSDTLVKAGDPLFRASFGCGTPFFVGILGENAKNPVFTLENGTLTETSFDLFDTSYSIESAEVSTAGIRVIRLSAHDLEQPGIFCILE